MKCERGCVCIELSMQSRKSTEMQKYVLIHKTKGDGTKQTHDTPFCFMVMCDVITKHRDYCIRTSEIKLSA